MKVVYNGVHDAVEVVDGKGNVKRCERSQPVELHDDLAVALIEQDTWSPYVDPKLPKKRASGREED